MCTRSESVILLCANEALPTQQINQSTSSLQNIAEVRVSTTLASAWNHMCLKSSHPPSCYLDPRLVILFSRLRTQTVAQSRQPMSRV